MARGKFVILEGGEGSGKTTIGERLKREFPGIVYTQDPGGTPLGEELRTLLMGDATRGTDAHAELLLFLAGRAELVAKVVRPALEAGTHVITNRWGLSTIAYQIYGRKNPELLPLLRRIMKDITHGAKPDACIVLDVPPSLGIERVHARPEEPTRFDKEALDFHARVRKGLLLHAKDFGKPYIFDSSKPLEEVWTRVRDTVQSIFKTRV